MFFISALFFCFYLIFISIRYYNSKSYAKIFLMYFRYIISLSLLGAVLSLQGQQNIVPNPSFEVLNAAPSCYGVLQFRNIVSDWTNPTPATPDLYSIHLPDSCPLSQPNSILNSSEINFPIGHQWPRSGDNFAGLGGFSQWYREYLEVELTEPMQVNQKYCCEMYVSFAEGSAFAHNNLGMYLSEDYVYQNAQGIMNRTAQIISEEVIKDTVKWVRIGRTYTPNKPFKYLLLGHFSPPNYSDVTSVNPNRNRLRYYYIDDVRISKFIPPLLTIDGNHLICPGDTLNLKANGWEYMEWFDMKNRKLSDTNVLSVKPSQTTTYKLKGTFCHEIIERKVTVEVYRPDPIDLGKTILICQKDTVTIHAPDSYSQHLWQDGSVQDSFAASDAGTYTLTALNQNGCLTQGSVAIEYYKPPSVNLGADFETCSTEGYLDASTGLTYHSYIWLNNKTTSGIYYDEPGLYGVTLTNPCKETVSDSVYVSKVEIEIPNIITPNDDNKNEYFIISGADRQSGILSIYNRLGSRVYYSENYQNDWQGNMLADDTYYYSFEYPTCEIRKGWIMIHR